MASTPSYAATPKTGLVTISTANTNRDGTGTIAACFTPGANGSRATSIRATATVTTSAAQTVRLYRSIDSGSTWKLWREDLQLAAVTINTNVAGATATVSLIDPSGAPLALASTDRLGVAAETANSMNIVTEYQDI